MSARAVQERLNAAGFGPLAVDGVIGPATLAALDRALTTPAVVRDDRTTEIDPNDALLIKELERDEGRVLHAYQDSLGYWTIGIGRLIDKRKGGGISNEEADYLKRNDIARFKRELDRVAPWWRDLDPVRQRVIQNMTFNLGPGWLTSWPNTVRMIRDGDWQGTAQGMRSSLWAKQVGARAERLARMMETGRAA